MKLARYFFMVGFAAFWPLLAMGGSREFVKTTLDIDPATIAFGSSLTNFSSTSKIVESHYSNAQTGKLDWYQTDASTKYTAAHPKRTLHYGFRDGKLAAVYVMIVGNRVDDSSNGNKNAPSEIDTVRDEYFRLIGDRNPDFTITYVGVGSTEDNMAAHVTITPPPKF